MYLSHDHIDDTYKFLYILIHSHFKHNFAVGLIGELTGFYIYEKLKNDPDSYALIPSISLI